MSEADNSKLPWGLAVRRLRIDRDLTQQDLAERMGTTKATVSKMERSTKRPSFEWMERLANALGVDVVRLVLEKVTPVEHAGQVPVIGMIAAGNWREAIREPETVIAVLDPTPHMFALRVQGDSIDRVAPDGSYVTIDPTSITLHDGKIYAVQNGDGDSTLKRFRSNPDRLEPDSTNPVHQPIMLGAEPITVVGRATSIIRTI